MPKNKKIVGKVFRMASIFLLLGFIVSGGLLLQSLYATYRVQNTVSKLSVIRQQSSEETKEEPTKDWSHGLSAINSDYAGWLTVYGTQAQGPVLLGETNDTYLRTDIYGEYSVAGTLFLDETTDLSQDGNRIIYGHKMNDFTMFGSLDQFKDVEFFNSHGTVCWESQSGTEYYQIFALMVLPGNASAKDFVDLQAWNNNLSPEESLDMLKTIEQRAAIYKGQSFDVENDKFLFLVTCDYNILNGRMVLAARRVNLTCSDIN